MSKLLITLSVPSEAFEGRRGATQLRPAAFGGHGRPRGRGDAGRLATGENRLLARAGARHRGRV